MTAWAGMVLAAAALSGCGPKPDAPESPERVGPEQLGATVGAACELTDYQSVNVQAYSLVVGLAGTGSTECPPTIKQYLLDQLRKLDREAFLGPEYADMTAEKVIESRSTALVMVNGIVPAGAPKGAVFDVDVRVPGRGTQTTSLQGGYLIRTELRMVVPGHALSQVVGRPTAVAGGPVFVNPFPQPGGRKSDPRQGVVLGGARSLYDRSITLSILDPDYRLAWNIQNRINARFQKPDDKKVADGTRSAVRLRVPEEYHDRYQHFIALVLHLYLRDTPGYLEMRLAELRQMALQPEANLEAIALAWEGIGRPALAQLRPFYLGRNDELAFFAARTAVNLGDMTGVEPLGAMASDPAHPMRYRAAQVLGLVAEDVHARRLLADLLDTDNARLRMLAYQGLRRIADVRVRTSRMPGGFALETVNCGGDKLVSVWATAQPRLVLFGGIIECGGDLFVETDDRVVTVNAGPDAPQFRILRQVPGTGDFITLRCARTVSDLVTTLARPMNLPDYQGPPGAGLSFSQIVGLLHQLHQQGALPAQFVLHRVPEDLLG